MARRSKTSRSTRGNRATGGRRSAASRRRSAAARKGRQTRKANAAKRSAAARKGHRTRQANARKAQKTSRRQPVPAPAGKAPKLADVATLAGRPELRQFMFAVSYKGRKKSVVVTAYDEDDATEFLERKIGPDDEDTEDAKWIRKANWQIVEVQRGERATSSRRSIRLRL